MKEESTIKSENSKPLDDSLFGERLSKNLDELRESRESLSQALKECSDQITKATQSFKRAIIASTLVTIVGTVGGIALISWHRYSNDSGLQRAKAMANKTAEQLVQAQELLKRVEGRKTIGPEDSSSAEK